MADGTYCAYFPFAILTEASLMRRYHNKLYFDEVIFDGIHHKICGILAPCLLKDIGTMLVYGALGDEELVGNLLIGETTTHLHENLHLALGEGIIILGGGHMAAHVAGHGAKKCAAEVAIASNDSVDSGIYLLYVGVLEEESRGTTGDHTRVVVVVAKHRERDNLKVGALLQSTMCGLATVDAGHGDIHEYYIDIEGGQQRQKLLATASVGNNFYIGTLRQQPSQPCAKEGVVVNKRYPNYLFFHAYVFFWVSA